MQYDIGKCVITACVCVCVCLEMLSVYMIVVLIIDIQWHQVLLTIIIVQEYRCRGTESCTGGGGGNSK